VLELGRSGGQAAQDGVGAALQEEALWREEGVAEKEVAFGDWLQRGVETVRDRLD